MALALDALRELGLDRVVLMPAHTAPYKSDGEDDPGAAHRLAMCRLAVAGIPGLGVCALEVERGGVSYTVDTLSSLHASHPEAELTLIVGADVAGSLGAWREPARLLGLARLAVAARPAAGHTGAGAPVALPGFVDPERVTVLAMQPVDVSSSLVRQRVARGEPVEELVGAAVAGYIAEHRLYRAPREALA